MTHSELLNLLADGEFRSGQALADALGVSRTAVWKQLNKLAGEFGLELQSVRGKGYRIPGGIDLLARSTILEALSGEARTLLGALQLHTVLDSTNSEVLRRAEAGCPRGYICCAEQQTAGRGRRGRAWISPFASNLYLSVLWEYEQGAAALEGLSLAVGVAVADALVDCGVSGVQLKWPNDVLHGGAKLGGILLEMAGDAAGRCQVVVGIGLNVAMTKGAAEAIEQDWTDIRAALDGDAPGRNRLLAALLNRLLPLLADFHRGGFAHWREAWLALDAFSGAPVIIDTGAQKTAGVARGVNERGALLLETTTGMQAVFGGEISMRPAA